MTIQCFLTSFSVTRPKVVASGGRRVTRAKRSVLLGEKGRIMLSVDIPSRR